MVPKVKAGGRPLTLTFRHAAQDGEFFPGLRGAEAARAKAQFRALDTSGDGQLDRREIKAMGEMLHQNWSDADVDDIFRRVDTDQSGAIDLEEFLSWWVPHREESALLAELRKMPVKAAHSDNDEHVAVVVPPGFSGGDEIIVSQDGYDVAVEVSNPHLILSQSSQPSSNPHSPHLMLSQVPEGLQEGDEFEAYVGHIGVDEDGEVRDDVIVSLADYDPTGGREEAIIDDGDDPSFPSPSPRDEDEDLDDGEDYHHDGEDYHAGEDYHDDDEGYISVVLVVPEGKTAGDVVAFELENGHEIEIEIPEGLEEGDEFEAHVEDLDVEEEEEQPVDLAEASTVPPAPPPPPPPVAVAAETAAAGQTQLDLAGIKQGALMRDIQKQERSSGGFQEPRTNSRQDMLLEIQKAQRDKPMPEP